MSQEAPTSSDKEQQELPPEEKEHRLSSEQLEELLKMIQKVRATLQESERQHGKPEV